jgi:hypothetical protein
LTLLLDGALLHARLGSHALLLRRALLLHDRTPLRGRLGRHLRRSLRRTAPLSAAATAFTAAATTFTAAAPFLSLTLPLLATGLLGLRRRGPEGENSGDGQSRYSTFLEQLVLHGLSPH